MGGCATKPRVLESEEAPAPVETPAPAADDAPVTAEKADTILQESESGGESKKEPLVDVTEAAAAEAPEEGTTNTEEVKPVAEAVPKEAEAKVKEEEKEVAETVPTTEAPKVAETVATPESPKA